ncbi:MAG TPA: hypothetical protein VLA68_04730 [Nitrososphaera sp.]|nr:hypothetical protein [Nitrososphaera sp.]
MLWSAFAAVAAILVAGTFTGMADAHFFGETKRVDDYDIIFMPSPSVPLAGSNSTFLNFSVLKNGSNIFNIYSAVVITEKNSGEIAGQIPYKVYEFSDITIPYTFESPGNFMITLQTRILGDEEYQAIPLEASFDITVDDPNRTTIPFDELMLFFVTPAAVAIAGIAIYLHSKKRL